jgi:polysaccharide pyruvyl transferase WcaK-like protein
MRIVAIGDIGVRDDVIHIGDEAMFEALVDALRSRGVEHITGLSAQPGESALRYGIDAVQSIGFPLDRVASDDRMHRVIATAGGESGLLEDEDPAHAVILAVRDSDGVVIAGGGNMTSLWPHHIYERATLGALATAFGKPLVVTGQTIGPELGPDDRALVTALLSSARLVGVREASSLGLVDSLGIAVEHTIDDASYLVSEQPTTREYTLVSLAGHVATADKDAVVTAAAELLDVVAKHTGLDTVFLPHFASLHSEQRIGDSLMHDRVIAAMTSPARLVTPTNSVDAARLAREASLVVSSRYHPVVFAVPAGVPTIGIPVDEYTGVKLRGALANFGQDGVLPVDDLLRGKGADVASRVWDRRAIIRADAAHLSGQRHAASVAWWDRVVEALRPSGA